MFHILADLGAGPANEPCAQLRQTHDFVTLIPELKAKGCFTEIIAYRTRVFVPLDGAETIITAIAAQP